MPAAPPPFSSPEKRTGELSPVLHATLWALVLLVLGVGLFLPDLMYGDAAQDAVMALRMFREGDFVHLLKNGQDYLDKPHLLFWSAMAGYRLFGVHDYSYRLPSVLVSLLGAFSAGRLGRRLYGARAGRMAALFFITAQATLLGNHDVRMDALLTGFTAFGLWQLVRWAETQSLFSLAAGAAGVGLGVASKGMVAAALSGLCLFLFLLGRRRLGLLASPRILVGLLFFLIALAPVLLCYYLQFDLHPEKVIDGRTGVSGVRFILFGQTAERFGGASGEAAAGDYLFFFHTLLWAFLPWTALLLAAWAKRLLLLWRGGVAAFGAEEQMSFLGPILYVIALNFSRFKLPHYLNVAFPLLAVATAGSFGGARGWAEGPVRLFTRVQDGLVLLLLAATLFLNGWAFPVRSGLVLAGALLFAVVLLLSFRQKDPLLRLWVPSAVAALFMNFVLEASFYPELSRYQPGSHFARRALALPLDWDRFFFLGEGIVQPFQFYTGKLIPAVDGAHVARVLGEGKAAFALVGDQGLLDLEREGLKVRLLLDSPDCRITMVTWPMLNPRTRDGACPRARLVEITR